MRIPAVQLALATGLLFAAPASFAQQVSETAIIAPLKIVDYWSGDLEVTGTVTPEGGAAQPVTAKIAMKIWLDEDGYPRLQSDDCVSALMPLDEGATLARGGRFEEDLEYAGSDPDCGMNPGDKQLSEVFDIKMKGDALELYYEYRWSFTTPYAGQGEASGDAVLKASYKAAPGKTKSAPEATPVAPVDPAAVAAAPAPSLVANASAPQPAPAQADDAAAKSAAKATQSGSRSLLTRATGD